MRKRELIEKWGSLKNKLRLLIVVVLLPSGALETMINTEYLNDKFKYILDNYDGELRLIHNPNIQIVEYIIL
jgi:hypothetical protein